MAWAGALPGAGVVCSGPRLEPLPLHGCVRARFCVSGVARPPVRLPA